MSKISPCLWFDGKAEEAAKFYVSLLPNSRIEKNPIDGPAGKAGTVLVVEFTLAGQRHRVLRLCRDAADLGGVRRNVDGDLQPADAVPELDISTMAVTSCGRACRGQV